MKVILAKNAGFCMGVRRAVETTLNIVMKEENGIATYGPLIHNPQVLDLLKERGVKILTEIPEQQSGTVIIRAHGVPPNQKKKLEASGAKIKDATCPRVVKVQVIIDKYRQQGFATVIIGDRNHAEVEGLMGYAGPEAQVVSNDEDVQNLSLAGPYIIVSQTTQDENAFERISRKITERFPNGKIFNTICDSTHKRQAEVRNLCQQVQAMVVVGGRTSANTARLGEIAASMGCPVYMVENEDDLDCKALAKYECIGVTAGASTPSWMINWVVRTLESIPSKSEGFVKPFLYRLFWLTLATNLYVSLAGGMITYVCTQLMGIPFLWQYFLISFGYLFAMHNLNRFSDQRSKKINDPVRADFYRRYRWPLLVASIITLTFSLTLTYGLGPYPFWIITVMSLLGILYTVRLIPRFISPIIRFRRLQEIPGSKTFFVTLAWAFVTALIPSLSHSLHLGIQTLATLVFVSFLVFVRNALFDVFEIHGDRIVGKETFPVFIGEKKTLQFLDIIMGLLVLLLTIFPALGWLPVLAYWLIPGIIMLAALIWLYGKGYFKQGLRLEFCLESIFFICAGLAWCETRAIF